MEIEVKYVCKDPVAIERVATDLGFVRRSEKKQIDRYYRVNVPTEKGREYLRIREDRNRGTCRLDFHTVVSRLETVEIEVDVSNGNDTARILEGLGLSVQCVVEKTRVEYYRSDVSLLVDVIEGLGTFIEVEANEADISEFEAILREIAGKLSLDDSDRVVGKGYPELILERIG